jgi:hypothetical protein
VLDLSVVFGFPLQVFVPRVKFTFEFCSRISGFFVGLDFSIGLVCAFCAQVQFCAPGFSPASGSAVAPFSLC